MLNSYFQLGCIVDDIDEAMKQWAKSMNLGPFYVMRHVAVEDFQYRGQPGRLDFSVALAQAGPVQVELIQQHDAKPSAFRDVYAPGQFGFHHTCGFVDDFDAEIARYKAAGVEVAHSGRAGEMKFAYVDTRATIGFMTEVIQEDKSMREFFKTIAASAENWDGMDPVRNVGL